MNIDVNSVLYLFIFILPGAFSKILRRKFSPIHISVEKNKGSLVLTAEIIVMSSVIFCLNYILIKYFGTSMGMKVKTSVIDSLTQADFLIRYIILTFFVTAVFTYAFFWFNANIICRIINWHNRLKGRPQETGKKTLWEDIFETNRYGVLNMDSIIIGVEKDGKEIAFGVLAEYPSPSTECDDLILMYGQTLKEYMEEDKDKPVDERRIGEVELEYVVFSKGITLKFYNSDNYRKFLTECILS